MAVANKPTTANGPEELIPWLRFPPFPAVPPGVVIIPFKDFKPSGLPIKAQDPEPDHVEVDGLGIPTVVLKSKHSLTGEEQARSKKRRKKNAKVTVNGVTRQLLWFEDWAEGEDMRVCHVDPNTSRVDRLEHASQEFKGSRRWPDLSAGVQNLWDAWRLYTGLITNVQQPQSKKTLAKLAAEVADIDDGDDDDDDMLKEDSPDFSERKIVVGNSTEARIRLEKERYANAEEKRNDADEQALTLEEMKREAKEARMDLFFNDPELSVKIFFSAHYREKGLIWDKIRCRDGPWIVQFFLEFLIRNRVLPESEKALRKAAAAAELAKRELPLTFVIGEALPDKVGRSFESLFGSFTSAAFWVVDEDTDEAGTTIELKEDDEEEKETEEVEEEETETKEEEDVQMGDVTEETTDPNDLKAFLASSGQPDIQIIDPNDEDFKLAEEIQRDAIQDNVDLNGEEIDPASLTWGDPPVDPDWGVSDSGWFVEKEASLTDYMGPTVLPSTHTTGIMERSTRQIIKVVPPPDLSKEQPKKKSKNKGKSPQELVEEELGRQFGYMVMAPWRRTGNYNKSDAINPQTLPDSRGPIVGEDGEIQNPSENPAIPVHNPAKDEILVLISSETVEKLTVGMGLQGTWVQIARQDLSAPEEEWTNDGKKKPKGKKGGYGVYGEPTKWWYLEQLMCAITSFHTDHPTD